MSKKTFMVSSTQKKHTLRSRQRTGGRRSYRVGWGYKLGAVLVVIGSGTILLLVAEFSGRKPLNAQEKTFLESYEILRSKLAHDDLVGARSESSVLARSLSSRIRRAAQAIADSNTLDNARLGFASLSQQAILLARNRKGYYVMYCPPVGCPQNCKACPMSRFSDWVQITPAIENPFTGGDETRCGVVRE